MPVLLKAQKMKLPFKVNKAAAKRVLHSIPAPKVCPYCGGSVKIVNNAEIYGTSYGKWPWMYACEQKTCDAYVGMHPDTAIPLGTLARKDLRDARKDAKTLFQNLWMNGGSRSRTEAYEWLAYKLDIPYAACHFGWFDEARCAKAKEILENEFGLSRTQKKPEPVTAQATGNVLQDF